MKTSEFLDEPINRISEEGLAASSARVLPAGTVVLSRDATVGRVAIMPRSMATSQHFANFVCGPSLRPRYLWLVMRTLMQTYFASLTDGATLRTIGMPDIAELRVPVPPLAEQDEIVSRAVMVRESSGRLLKATARSVELLQQRKQALITAAVTGELDLAREIVEDAS